MYFSLLFYLANSALDSDALFPIFLIIYIFVSLIFHFFSFPFPLVFFLYEILFPLLFCFSNSALHAHTLLPMCALSYSFSFSHFSFFFIFSLSDVFSASFMFFRLFPRLCYSSFCIFLPYSISPSSSDFCIFSPSHSSTLLNFLCFVSFRFSFASLALIRALILYFQSLLPSSFSLPLWPSFEKK